MPNLPAPLRAWLGGCTLGVTGMSETRGKCARLTLRMWGTLRPGRWQPTPRATEVRPLGGPLRLPAYPYSRAERTKRTCCSKSYPKTHVGLSIRVCSPLGTVRDSWTYRRSNGI